MFSSWFALSHGAVRGESRTPYFGPYINDIKEREKKLAAESGKESREKDKWRAYSHFLSLFCRNYCCI